VRVSIIFIFSETLDAGKEKLSRKNSNNLLQKTFPGEKKPKYSPDTK